MFTSISTRIRRSTKADGSRRYSFTTTSRTPSLYVLYLLSSCLTQSADRPVSVRLLGGCLPNARPSPTRVPRPECQQGTQPCRVALGRQRLARHGHHGRELQPRERSRARPNRRTLRAEDLEV